MQRWLVVSGPRLRRFLQNRSDIYERRSSPGSCSINQHRILVCLFQSACIRANFCKLTTISSYFCDAVMLWFLWGKNCSGILKANTHLPFSVDWNWDGGVPVAGLTGCWACKIWSQSEMSLIGPKELQHFNYMRELCTLLNMCAKLLNRSKQTTGKNILAAEFGFSVMIRDQRNTASFALLVSKHFRSVCHQHFYSELLIRSRLNLTK